jgi:hypothetical protein
MSDAQPPPQVPRTDYQRAAQDAMSSAKAAAQDALGTFMKLIYNPVGALPDAYRSLAPSQAIGVGIVFVAVAVVSLLIAGQGILGMVTGGFGALGFKGLLMGLGTTLGAAAGIALGSWLCRLLLRGEGNLAFDVFVGGATLLPIGIGVLGSYLLGAIGINGVIGQLPLLIGLSLAILVVFTALSRIAGIKEGLSSYLVAGVLSSGLFVAYLIGRILGKMLF